jgi:phosphatidylserine decarboxylase
MRLPLAREGFTHIAVAAALVALLGLLFGIPGLLIGLILLGFVINFFRDPERQVPDDPRAIVSPADGTVIKITDLQDDRFLRGPARLVSIFMSPLNVHVNRIPWSGRVVDVRYHPGKYLRAFADKASLDNEQNAVLVEDPQGRRLCFVQIAGFIARRIVCKVTNGDRVERGQRYGMILFGSRADIYLPPEVEIAVKLGDRTQGAQTVIGRWP